MQTRPERRAAFTFLEVLVALVICTVAIYACASALTASLRAEQIASLAQEAGLVCDRLEAARCAGLDLKPIEEECSERWTVAAEEFPFDGKTWQVRTVTSRQRSSLRAQVVHRM